jgi:Baseplate J-like protein
MTITTICQDKRVRRRKIRERNAAKDKKVYALDYIDISDDYRTLTVYFLGKAPQAPHAIHKENVRIDGGRRIRDIQVLDVSVHHESGPERDDYMEVRLDKFGDFSTYTLRLVTQTQDQHGHIVETPFADFDSRYAQVDFTFTSGCNSDLDCLPQDTCPPPALDEPDISYLAKDYASFRQLILDRLALVMPDWNETHVPDVGITFVEILAYVGDYLSYYQDAVSTEAYLETARQRISVRRHVRLVDYAMHEGCNARTWVNVKVSDDLIGKENALDPGGIYFITGTNETLGVSVLTDDDVQNIPAGSYEVFEPLTKDPIDLYKAHNIIDFYTWDDRECCLPRGATSATLRDHWVPQQHASGQAAQHAATQGGGGEAAPRPRRLHLQPGDFLVFEERIGPKTGLASDADPKHRHVVRLTAVTPDVDALYDRPVLEITWGQEDALPFPLCLSAIGQAPDCKLLEEISIARGNVILVDHGGRLSDEPLCDGALCAVGAEETTPRCEGAGHPADSATVPAPFNPALAKAPLTFSQPLPAGIKVSAAQLLGQDPRQALPQICISGTREITDKPFTESWTPQSDLLGSNSLDRHFVVEVDNDGFAHLRFGDGDLGRMPEVGTTFTATYRVGNGPAGNVGAGAITHIVFRPGTPVPNGVALEPYNPLPASGGIAPEPMEEVKLLAPGAFRTDLQRAVTPDDYVRLAERNPLVQRAAAQFSWTGGWYEVVVAIDPVGTEDASPALLRQVREYLYRYRRIGHDVIVVPATYVPLNIKITVCVDPHYLRGHVKVALLALLGNGLLPNGKRGFFHPDNLTFGQGIALSKLTALAQSVQGVQNVTFDTFERLFDGPNHELQNEFLPIGPMEIAQLDNDPSFPERGKLVLDMRGGR